MAIPSAGTMSHKEEKKIERESRRECIEETLSSKAHLSTAANWGSPLKILIF